MFKPRLKTNVLHQPYSIYDEQKEIHILYIERAGHKKAKAIGVYSILGH